MPPHAAPLRSAALAVAVVAVSAAAAVAAPAAPAAPSFVFIFTDDQDALLGGMDDMPFTLSLLRDGGTSFANGLVTTPICCPSRTALLSGMYGHNLEEQQIHDWCGDLTGHPIENATWITRLWENGYRTQMSGKYHNAPPQAPHVPLGWTDFFSLNNECQYYNNSFNSNGKTVVHGDAPSDYMTSLIGNRSLTFVQSALADGAPFLAYVAPHASHMPTTVAPWYTDAPILTSRAPRTPQYNTSGTGKHWVLAEQEPIPLGGVLEAGIDQIFAARHRALLSVDDIVRELAAAIEAAGRMNSTYWIYASDHGYNLGELSTPSWRGCSCCCYSSRRWSDSIMLQLQLLR